MPTISLDQKTYDDVTLIASLFDVEHGEVVRSLLEWSRRGFLAQPERRATMPIRRPIPIETSAGTTKQPDGRGSRAPLSSLGCSRGGKKKAKARLPELIRAGVLREGQALYLHDYAGHTLHGVKATIAGSQLLRNGRVLSMSKAAEEGLKEHGYSSDSVRGPAHWYTEDGVSVMALWDRYLRGKSNHLGG